MISVRLRNTVALRAGLLADHKQRGTRLSPPRSFLTKQYFSLSQGLAWIPGRSARAPRAPTGLALPACCWAPPTPLTGQDPTSAPGAISPCPSTTGLLEATECSPPLLQARAAPAPSTGGTAMPVPARGAVPVSGKTSRSKPLGWKQMVTQCSAWILLFHQFCCRIASFHCSAGDTRERGMRHWRCLCLWNTMLRRVL